MAGPVSSIIGGRRASEVARISVSGNPARPGEPVGEYEELPATAVDAAVQAAARGFETWRRRSALDRGRILRRAADLLAARTDELARLMTAEQGKTLADARREVLGSAEILEYHASSAWWPSGETFHGSRRDDLVRTLRVPVGVVGVITPWNFPVSIPVWKIAPALAHGNAVVWKPASPVPILSVRLAETLLEAGLDEGVLNVVLGGGSVGAAIVDHPQVSAISFTGGEPVGRRIGLQALQRNAKCQLELGGHNPAIVLADADVPVAVEALVRSIANGTGQKCTAARRVIVEEAVHDELVDALARRFSELVVGDGAEDGVDVGPLVDEAARDEVQAHVERALAEGCELVVRTPGCPAVGAFLPPTLLAAPDQSPTICREEVFGPVSAIVVARSPDHALTLAADTRFGLSAALFTGSERQARRFAEELPVGILNVNGPTTGTELHLPFGGTRWSSAPGPAEQGQAARDFYTDVRTIIATATR